MQRTARAKSSLALQSSPSSASSAVRKDFGLRPIQFARVASQIGTVRESGLYQLHNGAQRLVVDRDGDAVDAALQGRERHLGWRRDEKEVADRTRAGTGLAA